MMDVLRGLEDEMATNEVVEDGLTDVEVAFEEVLLVFLMEEVEVEVGFCISNQYTARLRSERLILPQSWSSM